ncbi:PREDICTED: taperin [Myotis davidii]|uniref:taperin n=1 Tax=Myotis davidii TaxID=225400 RepID=UPI0003EBCCA0|nr:PREDICTED: taperin [Myotis davidii]
MTPSPASATPSQRRWVSSATSANDSFEIRPASKPDMDTIPAGDLQARALASLRVNSRNSFVFVPKRKATGAPPPQGRRPVRLPEGEAVRASQRPQRGAQPVPGADGAPVGERSPLGVQEGACPRPATALVDQAVRWQRPSSPPPSLPAAAEAEPSQGFGVSGLAKNGGEPGRPGLPVTFIDEVDSEDEVPQEAKLPCSGARGPPRYHTSELLHQSGNTFTVVPKRKPGVLPANGEPGPLEAEEVEVDPLSEPPAVLGTGLKKRYPTVHEIEVIGGYLALQKSCLTKAGSSRKKMKISFNDKSLHTTFEYPSESSLVQEAQAEAEGEEEEEEEEEEEGGSGLNGAVEKPLALFLPRATFVHSVVPDSPRLPDGSSGLSSYTPKHSMAFSKWQEQPLAQAPGEVEPSLKEVMLTPASHNDLSDFRSEPALYF